MKVALVHDYLREYGGAERVLESLHQLFPEAPIYTAFLNPRGLGKHWDRMKDWDIKTSFLQKFPNRLISPLRILAPAAFESFDLSGYDLVISSCNIYFAKAVITQPETLHISYIHTPPRYLYGYTTSFNYKKKWLTKVLGELANYFLRVWDFEVSQRPDILVANSRAVQARIKKFYRRDSSMIYPPVKISNYKLQIIKKDYFLSVSRLVRGKGVDKIVEAAIQAGVELKVVGTGPLINDLKKKSGTRIEFLGEVNDEELVKLYAGARATIVASEDEDFGIVPVESMAAITPVIAINQGGFLETVTSKTGVFFDGSVEGLVEVLKSFDSSKFKISDLKDQAEKFSDSRFKKEILDLVGKSIKHD